MLCDEKYIEKLYSIHYLWCYLLRTWISMARTHRYLDGDSRRTRRCHHRHMERKNRFSTAAVVHRRYVFNNIIRRNIRRYIERLAETRHMGLLWYAWAIFLGAMLRPILYSLVFLGWRRRIARRLAEILIIWRLTKIRRSMTLIRLYPAVIYKRTKRSWCRWCNFRKEVFAMGEIR